MPHFAMWQTDIKIKFYLSILSTSSLKIIKYNSDLFNYLIERIDNLSKPTTSKIILL